MAGWIKIHDKLLDWEWAECPETLALWIHLLLRANFEDKRWQGKVIPRGSFITSVGNLSKTSGLSVRQVRTSLSRLISTNEVTIEATNKYTMISICKYDSYQLNESVTDKQNDKQSDNQTTNERQTNDKQTTTTSEYKTLKKEYISKDISSKESSELENEAKKVVCQKKNPLDFSFVKAELLDVFKEFLDMRRKIGKPLKTQKGIQDRYNTLIQRSGGNTELAIKIAKQSINHEWQDFYDLKTEQYGNNTGHTLTGSSRSEKDFAGRHYDTTLAD